MQRVAVVGCGGAGKSTLAAALGRLTGLPVVHLDRHYWQPGWVPTPPDTWRAVQTTLAAADAWIMDGNYGATLDVRLSRADTVVILALPRRRCLARVLRRWVQHHGSDWQAPGCPERPTVEFLRWIWRFDQDSRVRLDAALDRHRDRLRVVELRSPSEVRSWLDEVGPTAAMPAGAEP